MWSENDKKEKSIGLDLIARPETASFLKSKKKTKIYTNCNTIPNLWRDPTIKGSSKALKTRSR